MNFMEKLRVKNKHDLFLFAIAITASASLVLVAGCLI